MLLPRLVKRFILATVLVFLALIMVSVAVNFPLWVFLLSLPIAGFLTFLYWQTFSETMLCPTCNSTGKVTFQHGREIETDVCYSCDGAGRVAASRRW